MAAPSPSLASELLSGGLRASPRSRSFPSFSAMASPSPRLPLAPVRSASGALLGSVSSLPDGSPDPLLASVLRSYVDRLAAEERSRERAREAFARGERLPSSSVWCISDRD